MVGAILAQCWDDDVARVALLGVLAAEVAPQQPKLTARDVAPHPDAHCLESQSSEAQSFCLLKVTRANPVFSSAKIRLLALPAKSGIFLWLMSFHHVCPGGVCFLT